MLLFTLEGFSPAALSCYGASWNRTEAVDALATNGTTWDRVITPVTHPLSQLDQWLRSERFPAGEMTVVTDDARIGELTAAERIGELITIAPRDAGVAESLEDTTLAGLAAIAAEQLPDNPHVWLHSRFLTKVWDAPRELFPIDQFDEADLEPLDPAEAVEDSTATSSETLSSVPPILESWQPPEETILPDTDPDWIMAWMRTYGCQIRLVNALVGLLHEVAQACNHRAMIVAGTSGFSLGQNGAIGHRAGPLRSCHLHVPLVAAGLIDPRGRPRNSGHGAGVRDRRVQSADILPTVFSDLAGNANASPHAPEVWAAPRAQPENSVITSTEDQRSAITTDDWFYVRRPSHSDPTSQIDATSLEPGQLFLKPDDINDVNDVARLKPEVTERLDKQLG